MAAIVPTQYPPKHAPGKNVARTLRKGLHIVKARRDAGDFAGFATEELIEVPANTLVMEVKVHIQEAFTASTTITIGDSSVADRFLDSAALAPTAAGWKSSLQDANEGAGGHIYTSKDTIDMTLAGATPSAGTIHVYAVLLYDANEVVENYFE